MNIALRDLSAASNARVIGRAKYLVSLIIPVIGTLCLLADNWFAWAGPVVVFLVIPIIEVLMPAPTDNLSAEQEKAALQSRYFDLLVYSMVPMQLLALGYFLYTNATVDKPLWLWAGHVSAMGIMCGGIGINVAHELGHRRRRFEQNLAKILLFTTCYMHFFIEHNRGHHNKVATEDDPASARYGESLYAFLPRSIINSFIDAWRLEVARLRAVERPVLSWHNEMLRMLVYQGTFVAALFAIGGARTGLSFLAASTIGILMLETVNYIEHYGLNRTRLPNGRYERVLPVHSWNSNHLFGRMLLFELTRHSDHHANARRHYQVLRHFDESPQLPTGYPGMMVLAAIPPLFFAIMHPHIQRYRMTDAAGNLR